MSDSPYNEKFYQNRDSTLLSAQYIVPLIVDYIRPKSVVDVGCGLGEFLSVFHQRGIDDVLGIDGAWVDKKNLKISPNSFRSCDLESPLEIGRKFDLVISSEVAEHLPASAADTFVRSLVDLGDVVAFSAAIPMQGGTFHVNEQWPQYWADKFAAHDYVAIDCLRPKIWENSEVKFWYKQNLILYVRRQVLDRFPEVMSLFDVDQRILPLVHPQIFAFYARNYRRFSNMIPKPAKWLLKRMIKV